MNSHSKLYKKVIGPRGGVKWVKVNSATSGGWDLKGHPGEYKVTRFVNGWASGSEFYTITEEESRLANSWGDCFIPA